MNKKKLGIVISHPTQFEGPFFKYITKKNVIDLEVIYYDKNRLINFYDPELKLDLNWGINLLNGYEYKLIPEKTTYFWLRDHLKKAKYDLLIINGYNRLVLLYSIFLGKRYCKKIGLRLDTVEFENNITFKKFIKKKIYNIFNLTFDHFFAIGTLTKNFLKRVGIPESKVSIFSYVIDIDFFKQNSRLDNEERKQLRRKAGISEDAKVVLSVAKFSEREAPWDILKALTFITDINVQLLLVGDGPEKDKLKQFAEAHLKDKVTFAGYIKYPDLPKYYGISDLFIHSSRNEPWGVSIQEAIASGLPVIGADRVGATVDLIEENYNGFVYKINAVEDLSLKIKKVLFEFDHNVINITNERIINSWNYDVTFDNLYKTI